MRIPLTAAAIVAAVAVFAAAGQAQPRVPAVVHVSDIWAPADSMGYRLVQVSQQGGGGPSRVQVPRVIGMTVRTAREVLLWDHPLVTTITATEPTTSSAAALVIEQNPRPAAVVSTGSGVELTIGGGPGATGGDPAWPAAMRSPGRGRVVVPDLTGDTVGQAELTVRGVGLSFCPPGTAPTSDPAEVGRVMGQSPPVGAVVPAGAQVTVIVGQAERTDAHPASVWQAPVREVARVEPLPTPHARPAS